MLVSSWSLAKFEDLEIDFMILIACAQILHLTRKSVFGHVLHFWDNVYCARTKEHQEGKVDGSMNTLLMCLAASRNFEASDPRDKIFTLFGISDEGLKPEMVLWNQTNGFASTDRAKRAQAFNRWAITTIWSLLDYEYSHPALIVDYTKDLVELYIDLTRFLVRLPPRALEVLSYVSHVSEPSEGLFPSWVPKWFQKQSTSPLMVKTYNAGLILGPTRHIPRSLDNPFRGKPAHPDLLHLDGFRIDYVCKVSDVFFHDLPKSARILDAWSQLFDLPYDFPTEVEYRTGESLEQAFFLTLTAGILGVNQHLVLHKGPLPPSPKKRDQRYEQAKALVRAHIEVEMRNHNMNNTTTSLESIPTQEQTETSLFWDTALAQDYQSAVKAFSQNRRVYLTQKGYLGLGPKMMREGDDICVLYGGYVLFVLRQHGPQNHVFVGDTYVHDFDIMWGAFAHVVNTDASDIKNRLFILQ